MNRHPNAVVRRCVVAVVVTWTVSVLGACTSGHTSPLTAGSRPAAPSSVVSVAARTSSAAPASAPVPLCRRDQLQARYAGGGDGGQMLNGSILIWNSGAVGCRLTGRVQFSAMLANGRRDLSAHATKGQELPTYSFLLPAHTKSLLDGDSPGRRYVQAMLAGPTFAATGSCPDARTGLRFVAPTTFTVSIGTSTFTVANNDAHAAQNRQLTGCGGRIVLGLVWQPR